MPTLEADIANFRYLISAKRTHKSARAPTDAQLAHFRVDACDDSLSRFRFGLRENVHWLHSHNIVRAKPVCWQHDYVTAVKSGVISEVVEGVVLRIDVLVEVLPLTRSYAKKLFDITYIYHVHGLLKDEVFETFTADVIQHHDALSLSGRPASARAACKLRNRWTFATTTPVMAHVRWYGQVRAGGSNSARQEYMKLCEPHTSRRLRALERYAAATAIARFEYAYMKCLSVVVRSPRDADRLCALFKMELWSLTDLGEQHWRAFMSGDVLLPELSAPPAPPTLEFDAERMLWALNTNVTCVVEWASDHAVDFFCVATRRQDLDDLVDDLGGSVHFI